MATILIAADAGYLRDQLAFAFAGGDETVVTVDSGDLVRTAVAEHRPDVVDLDMQIGNMVGRRCLDLHLEEEPSAAPRPDPPPDRPLRRNFLAGRADSSHAAQPDDAGITGAGPRDDRAPVHYDRPPLGMWRSLVSAQRSGR